MARRWVRLVIVLITLTTLGFTANRIRLTERVLNDEHNVERVFTDLSWALTLTLADLRAAEQAYVAAGQDRVYWTTKVNSHLDTVSDSLANLRRLATAPGSLEALDEAEGTIADLQGMDQRAREHASLEQPLLASDLIFTDGLELASRAAANIELARATERTTRNEAVRTARSAQTTTLAAAAGVGVLMLLLLAPMPRDPMPREKTTFASLGESGGATERATPSNDDAAGLTRLDLASGKRARTARGAAAVAGTTRDRQSAKGPAARKGSAEPKPDLRTAADLCTDLSAMAASEELPALLARAADLMNASGLIVWVLDATDALRPAIGHGYPPKALARIGAIPSDSSNATAAAYRDVRMQVVIGSDGASGALATPLRSANRCVGVLSAELRDGWESSDAVQASAAIVAAQLATMLQTDPPVESEAPAEAPPAEAHG